MKFYALGRRNYADFAAEITPSPSSLVLVTLEGNDAKAAHKALGGWGDAPAPYSKGRAVAMENGEEITVHYKAHIYSEAQFAEFAAKIGGDAWDELYLDVQMCKAPQGHRPCDPDDDNEY